MTDILELLSEIEDHRRFCREWGIPLEFDRQTQADLVEIEEMAKEYLKQVATSQEIKPVEIDWDSEVPF